MTTKTTPHQKPLQIARAALSSTNYEWITLTRHTGTGKEIGIRISGCFPEDAKSAANLIIDALHAANRRGHFRAAPGFACVWVE